MFRLTPPQACFSVVLLTANKRRSTCISLYISHGLSGGNPGASRKPSSRRAHSLRALSAGSVSHRHCRSGPANQRHTAGCADPDLRSQGNYVRQNLAAGLFDVANNKTIAVLRAGGCRGLLRSRLGRGCRRKSRAPALGPMRFFHPSPRNCTPARTKAALARGPANTGAAWGPRCPAKTAAIGAGL